MYGLAVQALGITAVTTLRGLGREFLLPTPTLRRWYMTEGLRATDIAARVQVPDGMVLHQLARVLLIPDDIDREDHAGLEGDSPVIALDTSQIRAATIDASPFLLNAGPGTGKTRTLVARVDFLLRERHIPPSGILTPPTMLQSCGGRA